MTVSAEVDLTETISGLVGGDWQPLLVPLRCLRRRGRGYDTH